MCLLHGLCTGVLRLVAAHKWFLNGSNNSRACAGWCWKVQPDPGRRANEMDQSSRHRKHGAPQLWFILWGVQSNHTLIASWCSWRWISTNSEMCVQLDWLSWHSKKRHSSKHWDLFKIVIPGLSFLTYHLPLFNLCYLQQTITTGPTLTYNVLLEHLYKQELALDYEHLPFYSNVWLCWFCTQCHEALMYKSPTLWLSKQALTCICLYKCLSYSKFSCDWCGRNYGGVCAKPIHVCNISLVDDWVSVLKCSIEFTHEWNSIEQGI